MKIFYSILIFSLFFSANIQAQEIEPKEVDKPVTESFGSGSMLDNQTTDVYDKKTLEFIIQHKFGSIDNGIKDLYGIYAAGANIRLALNYVVIDNVQVGYGITKMNMHHDFNVK